MTHRAHLIVGQYPEPHTDQLRQALIRLGADVFCLNDDVDSALSVQIGNVRRNTLLRCCGQEVDGQAIGTVFWRVKSPMMGLPSNDEDRYDNDFRIREWRAALAGLNSALSHARWINPYEKHTYASSKIVQLNEARDVGLKIPETVVGNDARRVISLFERGEVIYKPLSNPFYSPNQLILTSKVTREEYEGRLNMVQAAPCLFQEYIDKAYELRITIIDNSLISVRIDSQASDATRTDWRASQMQKSLYSVVAPPPPTVVQGLVALMSRLGLVYGAVDMIVTPDGEYVFLEVNPGGQWLWIEQLIGVPITAEIAHVMARGAPERFGVPRPGQTLGPPKH